MNTVARRGTDRAVPRMIAATLATGVAAGVLGAALTLLLHAIQHVCYGYSENTFLVGVERASDLRRVLVPAVGGVVAGLAWWGSRRVFTVDSVSVTHALRDERPDLPVRATVIDAVIQIFAVAIGASLGREGAPRQVGAAVGGRLGRWFGVRPAQQRVLLAAGAGAGLAAVYNVPLGGAAFTVEVLLASLAWDAVLPALVTSVVAAAVSWPVLGTAPTYRLPAETFSAHVLAWSAPLGVVAGVLGVVFIRTTTSARLHAPRHWPVVIAVPVVFTAIGALAVAYPQLPGNGRSAVGLAFDGALGLGLAAVLLGLKPLVTAACLGAGAIGGTLTPALATGALLGAVAARVSDHVWPGGSPVQFAVVCAAAFLAVTQRAPVTAMLLTYEFVGSRDAALLAPMLVAVVVSSAVAAAAGHRGALVTALLRQARRRRR